MTNILIALIAAVFAALATGVYLGYQGRKIVERFETLEEISRRRKLPYPALAGLEDAIALTDDARYENNSMDRVIAHLLTALQKDVAARQYQDARFEQIQDILKTLRQDPHSYDADGSHKIEE